MFKRLFVSLEKKQSMHSGELCTGVFKNNHSSFAVSITLSFVYYVFPFALGDLAYELYARS